MAQVTVKSSGGDYASLKAAIDAAETDILISGTWGSLPAETNNITWDTAGVSVTCDSDSKWDPSKPRTGGTYHYALNGNSNGSHVITVSVAVTLIEGIEIKQASTGGSDECFRFTVSGTVNIKKCLVWTGNATADQDGLYTYHGYSTTVNLENCCIVDCRRAGVNWQKYATSSGNTITININSCTIFNCGTEDNDNSCGGVVAYNTKPNGTTECFFYVYNSVIYANISTAYDLQAEQGAGSNNTWVVDRCIYGRAQANVETITDSTSGAAIDDTTGQGVGYVYVEDATTAPYDLRLVGTDSDCEALDMHTDGTGPNSLTAPSDDIMGTSRPQNTNYDAGFFEYVAAGGSVSIPVLMRTYRNMRT